MAVPLAMSIGTLHWCAYSDSLYLEFVCVACDKNVNVQLPLQRRQRLLIAPRHDLHSRTPRSRARGATAAHTPDPLGSGSMAPPRCAALSLHAALARRPGWLRCYWARGRHLEAVAQPHLGPYPLGPIPTWAHSHFSPFPLQPIPT